LLLQQPLGLSFLFLFLFLEPSSFCPLGIEPLLFSFQPISFRLFFGSGFLIGTQAVEFFPFGLNALFLLLAFSFPFGFLSLIFLAGLLLLELRLNLTPSLPGLVGDGTEADGQADAYRPSDQPDNHRHQQANLQQHHLPDQRIRRCNAQTAFDYTKRSGVEHTEIIALDSAPDWMRERSKLWNVVEIVEKRKS
jgi:hypothetical protein